jgi:hypothetical protein
MSVFTSVVQAVLALAVGLALLTAGPLCSIAVRERHNRTKLNPRGVIGAGVIGSWVLPGVLVVALYISELFGVELLGSAVPLAPMGIRVIASALFLTILGAAVGCGVLVIRNVRSRRLAH